jgi:dihydrodipicolinate synthase/N-acetylneuraminate lyase
MKDIAECRARLDGLFNITTTPFRPDESLDTGALAENIGRVLDLGFDGVLIGGTYGEFPAMSPQERADLFRMAMDVVGDRAPVMLCSAHSDRRVVHELTVLASDLGGLPMITPPFVSEATDEQIVDFFAAMAPLSRTGILVYNAPGIGINLSARLLERLADLPGIVGVKQGDLTPTTIDIMANRLKGRIKLFCASDLAFLGPLMAGFDGLSSTNSSAIPEVILKSFRSCREGDATTARDLHRSWYALRDAIRRFGQPQTTKAVMTTRGFKGGSVRPPLVDLSGSALEEIHAIVAGLNLDPATGLPTRLAI